MTKACRFCGADRLEFLISFPDYPIFIGCSNDRPEEDECYNFEICICKDCQIIQQVDLPPLELLYKERRAFGLGRTWKAHYDAFYEFIRGKLGGAKNMLEVGGGNGVMLRKFTQAGDAYRLSDVEPDPHYELPNVTTYRVYFDKDFWIDDRFDLIYASHLIEHLGDVNAFFSKAHALLRDGGKLITACPNIIKSFENLHLNAFTTDHFNYFSPTSLQSLAAKHGFSVSDFFGFRDHGMYFQFSKREDGSKKFVFQEDLVSLFRSYNDTIVRFANYVNSLGLDRVFVFGAHGLTITFLRYLGTSTRIDTVLDNEPTKHDRRLAGTNLICRKPDIIRDIESPTVMVYMGAYTAEICEQLKSINPTARVIRLDQFAGAGRC